MSRGKCTLWTQERLGALRAAWRAEADGPVKGRIKRTAERMGMKYHQVYEGLAYHMGYVNAGRRAEKLAASVRRLLDRRKAQLFYRPMSVKDDSRKGNGRGKRT